MNRSQLAQLGDAFRPNKLLSRGTVRLLILGEVSIFLIFWILSPTMFLPKPGEVVSAFVSLWNEEGLGVELVTSLVLNVQALLIASILSLGLAYSTVVPAMRPIVSFVGKLRFLSLVGLSFFFVIETRNGHELKVSLLVFAVTVFFVVSMADVVASIPKESFDLARTLRMSEWHTVWEVVVLGQADRAFDSLRQNAAMSWMMITLVEGISRAGGGVGSLLLNQSKYFHLSGVFAIQITILLLGLAQDYGIGAMRKIICPYADLRMERR